MNDRRIIEDYLPIEQLSEEASGEPRTKGHLSTLHIWRARRPLVACRAAVYSALVPSGGDRKEHANFVARLCRYPGDPQIIREAQQQILEAHAARLSMETGAKVSAEDIVSGRMPRPKVIDPFSGGGAIPLEALRLGCESHALDLNPVAHIIELCTVRYPQEFGPSLATDIEKWARWILDRVQPAVADLYPVIPLPGPKKAQQVKIGDTKEPTAAALSVVAYYWTRTVPCPNPACKGTVPLYRQTWLRKKQSGYVALRANPDLQRRKVFFEVVKATTEAGLGFDPSKGTEGSATACPFCTATVSAPYVREYGDSVGFGQQLMCVIGLNPAGSGKIYVVDNTLIEG